MERQEVAIVEIRIPFLSLVTLLLKLAVAAIPIFVISYVLIVYILFALNNLHFR
jgi:hypothetical protein